MTDVCVAHQIYIVRVPNEARSKIVTPNLYLTVARVPFQGWAMLTYRVGLHKGYMVTLRHMVGVTFTTGHHLGTGLGYMYRTWATLGTWLRL